MTKEEALNCIREWPKLAPLTEMQGKVFAYLWAKCPTYEQKRALVGEIPDIYSNRLRYKELLSDQFDRDTFDRILSDPETRC